MDAERLTEDNGKQFWNPNISYKEFCASCGNRSLSVGNEQKPLIINLKKKLRDYYIRGRIILNEHEKLGWEYVVWFQLAGTGVLLQASMYKALNISLS